MPIDVEIKVDVAVGDKAKKPAADQRPAAASKPATAAKTDEKKDAKPAEKKEPPRPELPKGEIGDLCKELASGDQLRMYHGRVKLTAKWTAAGAPGKENERTKLAKDLAACLPALQPEKDKRGEPTETSMKQVAACQELFRVLSLVGGAGEVGAVAACLKQIDLRETARYCLERLNCQEATDALVNALRTLSGNEFRCGLLNSLARKSGSNVNAALKECLGEKGTAVRLAAVEALANQPELENDAAIASVKLNGRGAARVIRARLRLGYTLLKADRKDQARKVFDAIGAGPCTEWQKKAVEVAMQAC
ncbi:MAG: hypothetical protein JSS27_13215 [Planctomycetes bacterium]|nr:hypothetical protein [Planctomycetota bacterium]